MAGQQDLKNYTRLWNPILEAMTKARLTPNQYKICLALFQRTYTWRKKEARMGYRDFEKYTGIKAKKIGQPFRQLIERRVIIEVEKPSFNSPGLYKFNKDIRQWSPEVIDINQLTETNLSIVMEECEGTVPIKGTPPKEGDTPPNKGEGSPQNGGEGTPHEGDTKQASNPCGSSDSEPPKESIKENFKEIDDDDNTRADEINLYQAFEKEFGRTLGPMEINQIKKWGESENPQLVLEALRKAVMRGKFHCKYIDSILLKWEKNNIHTIADVEAFDQEFEKRRKERQRDGPTGKNVQRHGSQDKPGQSKKGKYSGLIPTVGG